MAGDAQLIILDMACRGPAVVLEMTLGATLLLTQVREQKVLFGNMVEKRFMALAAGLILHMNE